MCSLCLQTEAELNSLGLMCWQRKSQKNLCVNLRPDWSTDWVSGHSSLGNEGNHQEQKSGEVVIKQRGHVPAPVSKRIQQFQLHGCDFRIKDRRKGLWNLPQQLKKAIEVRHVSRASIGVIERPLYNCKVKAQIDLDTPTCCRGQRHGRLAKER